MFTLSKWFITLWSSAITADLQKNVWKPKGRRETEKQGREESEEKANDTDPLSTVAFLSSFDQMLTELQAQ